MLPEFCFLSENAFFSYLLLFLTYSNSESKPYLTFSKQQAIIRILLNNNYAKAKFFLVLEGLAAI